MPLVVLLANFSLNCFSHSIVSIDNFVIVFRITRENVEMGLAKAVQFWPFVFSEKMKVETTDDY